MKHPLLTLSLFFFSGIGIAYGSGRGELGQFQEVAKPVVGQVKVLRYKSKDSQGREARYLMGVLRVDAAPEMVWKTMVKRYSRDFYKTGILYNKPIKDSTLKDVVLVDGRLDIPLFDPGYTIVVRFYHNNYRLEWRMLTRREVALYRGNGIYVRPSSSSLRKFEGYECLKPSTDGLSTKYYRAAIVESKVPLPVFVEREIIHRFIECYMGSLKEDVEARCVP